MSEQNRGDAADGLLSQEGGRGVPAVVRVEEKYALQMGKTPSLFVKGCR